MRRTRKLLRKFLDDFSLRFFAESFEKRAHVAHRSPKMLREAIDVGARARLVRGQPENDAIALDVVRAAVAVVDHRSVAQVAGVELGRGGHLKTAE